MIITRSWPSATTRDWAIIQTNMTLRLLLKGKTIFQQSSWSSHKGHPYNHHDQHDHDDDDDVNDGQEGPLVGGQKGEWGHPQMHKGSASEAALTSRWSRWSWSDGEKKLKKLFDCWPLERENIGIAQNMCCIYWYRFLLPWSWLPNWQGPGYIICIHITFSYFGCTGSPTRSRPKIRAAYS